jgi:hypothetical protein
MGARTIRSWWVLVLGLAALGGAAVHAQGTVTVSRPAGAADPIEAVEGRPLTLPFVVETQGTDTLHLAEQLTLPPGWQALPGEPTFVLPPGGRALRLAVALVPADAVGTYRVGYAVQAAGVALGEATVAVRILERHAVAVGALEAPGYGVAGVPAAGWLVVRNEGNVPERVRLRLEAGPGLHAATDSTAYVLEPGLERRLPVTLVADAGAEGHHLSVEVAVTGAHDGGRDWGVGRGALFAVGPPGPRGLLPFTYPLTLSAAPSYALSDGAGSGSGSALAFAAYGEGPLREGGRERLRFNFTPPILGTGMYGDRRGRYYAGLLAPRYDLEGGDVQPVSSVLHDANGFGAVARARLGTDARLPAPGQRRDAEGTPFEAAAFAVWDRYGVFSDTTYGGRLAVAPAAWWGLGVTGTRREGFFEGEVATADVRIGLPDAYARVEAGTGRTEGVVTPGLTAEGRANGWWGSFAARVEEVGHSFPSYNADRRRYSGSAHLALGTGWTLTGFGDHLRQGSFLSTDGLRDRVYARAEAGLLYRGVAALRYRYAGQQQGLSAETYRSAEHLAELSGQAERSRWSLSGRLRAGLLTARSPQGPASNLVVGAGATARYAAERASAAVSASYTRGAGTALPGVPPGETMQLAVQAAVPVGSVSLFASGAVSWYRAQTTSGYFFADAGASTALPWRHRLDARARVGGPLPGSAFGGYVATVGFTYTVPLEIPLGRSRQTGLVRGALADQASGQGLPGVPVFLEAGGRRVAGALTDAEGQFWLDSAPVGPAAVVVGDGGPEAAFVVRGGARVPVEIVGGGTATLALQASALGEVAVEVVVVDTLRGPHGEVSRVDRRGVGCATLALLSPNGAALLTRTDGRGAATFRQVYPGTYALRVVAAPVEGTVLAVPDSATIGVTANGRSEATFTYATVRRTERIINAVPIELGAVPVSLGAAPTVTSTAPEGTRTYVVLLGDWLSKIAREVYGGDGHQTWQRIFETNRHLLPTPEALEPGMVLTIPPLQ